jgi:hypothetical protein
MTRLICLVLLFLHFYYECYGFFSRLGLHSGFTDRILGNICATGLYGWFHKPKLIALGFLCISLLGAKGRKDEKLKARPALWRIGIGLGLYFGAVAVMVLNLGIVAKAMLYMALCTLGLLLVLSGGIRLSRIITRRLDGRDIFNALNETFPQEERLLENEYSVNLPARYRLKDKVRESWINIINPFRALMVLGTPGSGKSYFVIRHVITQHIAKGFTMFVYDFKFDDLSRIAYNAWLRNRDKYPVPARFYVINFDDLSRSHRCNPLEPSSMTDITDAAESARTILLGLNREWIKRQGDFFVESPINFLTAIIWYLRKYNYGEFLKLPHDIEFMKSEY